MTAIDPAAVHADPDGGIRWSNYPQRLVYANPVISVGRILLHGWLYDTYRGDTAEYDPQVAITGEVPPFRVLHRMTEWRIGDDRLLYRVHSYDPDTDCYLLVWPD